MTNIDHVEIDEEYGSASGYVVASDQEQVRNYLSDHAGRAAAIAAWFQENSGFVSILKNINVDEDERGKGYRASALEHHKGMRPSN
jgi:hypothetical protein